jgi:riboflavin kinase/FMN adenylyltransferase
VTKIIEYKSIKNFKENSNYKDGNVLTIGFFDGVHIGHQKILKNGKKLSLKKNIPFVVLTFHPHPDEIIFPDRKLLLLTSLEDRIKLIMDFGVDLIIVIPFTKEFSLLNKERFLEEIVKNRINPKYLVIGEDFRFGHKADGNVEFLLKYFKNQDISVNVIPLLKIDKSIISSTLIRKLIMNGKISYANKLLGRNFKIYGSIIKGRGVGSSIGFPTLNIKTLKEILLPGDGVYLGRVKFYNSKKYCLINIGKKPTFDGKRRTVETYILNIEGDEIKKLRELGPLTLYFIKKLRDEIKFESVEKLIRQIKRDIKKAREIIKSINF